MKTARILITAIGIGLLLHLIGEATVANGQTRPPATVSSQDLSTLESTVITQLPPMDQAKGTGDATFSTSAIHAMERLERRIEREPVLNHQAIPSRNRPNNSSQIEQQFSQAYQVLPRNQADDLVDNDYITLINGLPPLPAPQRRSASDTGLSTRPMQDFTPTVPQFSEFTVNEPIPQPPFDLSELEFEPDENSDPFTNNQLLVNKNPRDLIHEGDESNGNLTWWHRLAIDNLNPDNPFQTVSVNDLVFLALKNSPRIRAISQDPLIRELQIIESETIFDPVQFVQSNYNQRNDPVGNTLVTGGPPFLQDNIWDANLGVRRLTPTGANVELSQRLGFQNSNSLFFVPQDQGTATLALNVAQPLLRGRGRYINQTQILIAQAASTAAWETFSEELQEEIEGVIRNYWRLYFFRSVLLQKKRNVDRGEEILALLEGRSQLDSLPSQIARAKSAVQNRATELANAYRDVRNAETEIRRQIADREWLSAQSTELIPLEIPQFETYQLPLETVVQTALENRPEVKQTLQQARINNIRLDIANNQILPDLSFLIGGYVSALNGNSGVLNSLADQFGNAPGYNVGLAYEMPYGNRLARSRLAQQKLQIAKVKAEIDEAMQMVIAESQVALRRIESAVTTRSAAYTAIEAAMADLFHQQQRWATFGLTEGDLLEGQNATLLLNQVLDAQERLAAAELVYAQTELELKLSEVGLQRAMGTLLMHQQVDHSMIINHDDPQLLMDKRE